MTNTARRNHAVTDTLYAWVDQRISIILKISTVQYEHTCTALFISAVYTLYAVCTVCHAIFFIQHSKMILKSFDPPMQHTISTCTVYTCITYCYISYSSMIIT